MKKCAFDSMGGALVPKKKKKKKGEKVRLCLRNWPGHWMRSELGAKLDTPRATKDPTDLGHINLYFECVLFFIL